MTPNQEPRAAAIKAAIATEMPAGVPVYDVDEVPGAIGSNDPDGTPPARYVSIEVSRSFTATRRLSEDVMLVPGAVTTHYRGPEVSDVRELRRRTVAALENRIYDVASGEHIGPFVFEIDGGLLTSAEGWSGWDTWQF